MQSGIKHELCTWIIVIQKGNLDERELLLPDKRVFAHTDDIFHMGGQRVWPLIQHNFPFVDEIDKIPCKVNEKMPMDQFAMLFAMQ